MQIRNLYPGSFGANCYLLTANGHAAIVDPSANATVVTNALRESGAVLDYILLTHGHFDHMTGMDDLRALHTAPVCLHEGDADMPSDAFKNAFYTFFHTERTYLPPDRLLKNDERLDLGGEEIRVLHTPGHTRGSVCFLCNQTLLLTGDTLFSGGTYGRYDLYGGDAETLFASLRALCALDGSLHIYPGHGEPDRLSSSLDCIFS